MSTTTLTDITGDYTVDASHSRLGFVARHAMVTKVRGQFDAFTATAHVDAENPAASTIELSIDVASVTTGSPDRDGHLRSADFFDVEKSGPMTFTTTSFDGTTARGELTIKGQTHPVELDVDFLGVEVDAYGNTVLGYEASTEISRKAWGVDFQIPLDGGKVLVGDKVTVVLSVQAILAQQ